MGCAFRLAILFALLTLARVAPAQNIAIVLSEDSASYIEIADLIRRVVNRQASEIKLLTLQAEQLTSGEQEIFRTDFYNLVVAVGARAANIVANLRVKSPVLNTLIPRALYEQLPYREGANRSAIYMDHPLSRQLELARLVMPGKTRLGVIYGPQSARYSAEVERQAQLRGFTVVTEAVQRTADLGPTVQRVLDHADSFFVLPDADIFNRTTISKILLSSYHSADPVIAFSAYHVKSGALAALITAPEHLARHIGEMILKLHSDGKYLLPAPQYPMYWSVSVNRQVAHSLGLSIPSDQELQSKLSLVVENP